MLKFIIKKCTLMIISKYLISGKNHKKIFLIISKETLKPLTIIRPSFPKIKVIMLDGSIISSYYLGI